MPLNEKGKKIMTSMKKQYGKKKGEDIFYAMENSGKLKKVVKARGGMDASKDDFKTPSSVTTSSGNGGRDPTKQFEGSQSLTIKNKQALAAQRKAARSVISPSTTFANKAIALAAGLVVPGGGFLYKRAIDANTPFAPKRKKQKPITTNNMNGGNGDSSSVMPIAPTKPIDPLLVKPKENFFNFKAYNSGGVSSGPPPKRGPNPQVPPIKMKKGKMNSMTCPNRPDGIRGMGAAIKGFKFIGVK